MNTSGAQIKPNHAQIQPIQNTGNSISDKFSKQLGQHGFLKHSGTQNYSASSKYTNHPYDPNATDSSVREEQEPYRREAGKSQVQGAAGNDQNRGLGSRNINRRIVEENLLRNQSAERMRPEGNSFRAENINNNSFQHKYDNTLDAKHDKFYQNKNTLKQPNLDQLKNDTYYAQIQKQYEQLKQEKMGIKQYEQQSKEQLEQKYDQMRQDNNKYMDQDQFNSQQNDPNNYMQDFYHPQNINRDEVTQTPEPEAKRDNHRKEFENENSFKSRDRSLPPYNPNKLQVPQKQVQFQAQPQVYQQDQVSETHSKYGDIRSREAVEDAGKISEFNLLDRENVEQERYYARLRRATSKQSQIFQSHLSKYYIPQKSKEQMIKQQEDERIRQLKAQASQYEKQQRENIKTIQGEYSEFLSNQMKEREFTHDIEKQQKKYYGDDIKMKYTILKQKEDRKKIEKLENQIVYRGALLEQQKFRNVHPEAALKLNEAPKVQEFHSSQVTSQRSGLHHYPSNSSLNKSKIPSQDLEPVGPVNANIGHKSNYIGPNPILAPISDPLYNPYIRREVTNSLHDPKKKSIYIPPNTFAF